MYNNQFKNPTFGGFKPDAMQRIASTLGYTGDMSGFQSYLANNPDKQMQMDQFKQAAMTMARGGAVQKFQVGGTPNYMGSDFKNINAEEAGFKAPTGPATQGMEFYYNPTTQQKVNVMSGGYEVPEGFVKGNSMGYQNQPQPMPMPTNAGGMQPLAPKTMQLGPNVTTPQVSTEQPLGTTPKPPPPMQFQKTDTGYQILDQSGKVVKTNLDNIQQVQDYVRQQNAKIGTGPSDGGPAPVSMPEPLGEDVIKQYTADAPGHLKGQLAEKFKSGNLPADPNNYTISGGSGNWTITYGDGTTIKNTVRSRASVENDAANILPTYINKLKESPEAAEYKAQQDAYRNYLSSSVTGGVTGDIANIEQEYTNARSNYTQQNLELQRLQQQAAANPNDPYLKELVEAKGKEVSDTYGRLQQLQPLYQSTQKTIKDVMTERATDPTLPEGARVDPTMIKQEAGQFIEAGSGQVSGEFGVSEVALADTYLSQNVDQPDTAKYEADVRADQVAATTSALQAAQTNEDDARAKVTAAMATASMVGDLDAAQGTATLMENEVQREIQDGELVSGAAADATKAAKFTEQIDAATATPSEKATVQGQLVGLMEQFEGTTPPPWAAGAIRLANQQMAARGLSASSMAGQAIVQAAMESALPIAQADAKTQADFESQNLSNRQARAMLAAEQRAQFLGQEFDQEFQTRVLNASKISDIANMNFDANQLVQLENARAVQTMNLENLSNRQAMVLAEASALANLDMGNLNNRQQTAVQNAQNFLQLDMANLSNEQQTELFKTQQNIQAMLTDQAANNAAMQFNAQSENQANQFYDNLNSTINMFNSEQKNAQERFNAGQVNAANQFNAEMQNQREQFNAQNQLVVDQSNATWRREIATADTAAINRANELNAINTLDISNTAYNNMWQLYGDQMEWAWTSAENQQDRLSELAQEQLTLEERKMMIDAESSKSFGNLVSTLLFTDMSTLSKTFAGSLFR